SASAIPCWRANSVMEGVPSSLMLRFASGSSALAIGRRAPAAEFGPDRQQFVESACDELLFSPAIRIAARAGVHIDRELFARESTARPLWFRFRSLPGHQPPRCICGD